MSKIKVEFEFEDNEIRSTEMVKTTITNFVALIFGNANVMFTKEVNGDKSGE